MGSSSEWGAKRPSPSSGPFQPCDLEAVPASLLAKPCGTTLFHGRLGSRTTFSLCLFPNFSPTLLAPVTSLHSCPFSCSGSLVSACSSSSPSPLSSFLPSTLCTSLPPSLFPLSRYDHFDQGPPEQPAGHEPQENCPQPIGYLQVPIPSPGLPAAIPAPARQPRGAGLPGGGLASNLLSCQQEPLWAWVTEEWGLQTLTEGEQGCFPRGGSAM